MENLKKTKFWLPIILYDSECTLCIRFKMALERIPGMDKYNMISIHNDEIYRYFPSLNKQKCHQTIHIIDEQKNIIEGGDAISHLIAQFPVISKFSWLMEKEMGKKAVNFFYDVVNKYRESLLNHCPDCKKSKY